MTVPTTVYAWPARLAPQSGLWFYWVRDPAVGPMSGTFGLGLNATGALALLRDWFAGYTIELGSVPPPREVR